MESSLIGQKFHKVTVIKRTDETRCYGSSPKGKFRLYLCRCDCGTQFLMRPNDLKHGTRKSCGCLPHGKTYLSPGEGGFKKLLTSYKRGARDRNLPFDLPTEAFRSLTQENCYYCGCPPTRIMKFHDSAQVSHSAYTYNGIDRIDASKGYVLGNCVACCTLCNTAKMRLSMDEFIALANRIAAKHPK